VKLVAKAAWLGLSIIFAAGPLSAQPTAKPIVRGDVERWAAAWNSRNIETVMTLFSADVAIYQPSNPKPLDAAGSREFFSMIFKAYPDFHVELTDVLIDGMRAVSVERVTGTWSGPYTDPVTKVVTPGNGRTFDHPGAMLLTYRANHTISEVHIFWDQLMVDRQLGILPK
jgi:steroid delta-isomerase-like uncharacterized protein